MAALPRPTFRSRLRGLDGDRFAEFVTELWRARGIEVRRDGERLRVLDDEGPETVFVHHRSRWVSWGEPKIPEDANVVVTNTRGRPAGLPTDTRHVGPDEVYDMVVYAIPRDRADTLCRRFFGRPVVTETDDPSDADRPATRTAALVAVLCVSLVGAAVAVVAGSGVGSLPGIGQPPTPTFGPPVDELPYSQTWPEDERAPAGPGSNPCFEPAVDDLPYTVMRPDRDVTGSNVSTPGAGTPTPTPTSTDCRE